MQELPTMSKCERQLDGGRLAHHGKSFRRESVGGMNQPSAPIRSAEIASTPLTRHHSTIDLAVVQSGKPAFVRRYSC